MNLAGKLKTLRQRLPYLKTGGDKIAALQALRSRGVPIAGIIDVGVKDRTHELIEVFPDRPQLLFEPVAEFAGVIARNYAGIEHRFVQAAVSDEAGEATLAVESILPGNPITHSRLLPASVQANSVRRTVPVVTLDGYLAANPWPAPWLLKLDVDGLEMQILRGAEQTLAQTSVVQVEVPQTALTERIAFLEARGFALFDLVARYYYDGAIHQCDAVMVKSDLLRQHFRPLLNSNFDPARFGPFRTESMS